MRTLRRPTVAMLTAAAIAVALGLGSAPAPAAGVSPATDESVATVASQLRCVVCQNLSVADSPSEMARQMREVIRERLGLGETEAEVRAYFVDKYGEWVLLSPRPRGFNLLLWILPFAGLGAGLGLVLVSVRRWSRRPADAGSEPALMPGERERIEAELDRLRE